MKRKYVKVLEQSKKWLEEHLQMDVLIDYLEQEEVLQKVDVERLRPIKSNPDVVLSFINILKTKPTESYENFVKLLDKVTPSMEHVKNYFAKTEQEVTEDEDINKEALFEHTLSEVFIADSTGKSVPKEKILNIFRVGLRLYHKQWLAAEDEGLIFKLMVRKFPEAKLKRNHKRQITAVHNICIKQDLQIFELVGSDQPAELDTVPKEEVAIQMRPCLVKLGLDPELSEKFYEQDIDGQLLSEFTDAHISRLYSNFTMGMQMKLSKAVTLTVQELKKNLQADFKQINREQIRETFREFDTRPKSVDVYGKGYILASEDSELLLRPVHKFSLAVDPKLIAAETTRFAAACMNGRVNGTIHFGVSAKSSHDAGGKIIGISIDKMDLEIAVTDEICRAFFDDQIETALMCIRNPAYIPVHSKEAVNEQAYVVEIDIVPSSNYVTNDVFFLRPKAGHYPILLKYTEGVEIEVKRDYLEQYVQLLTDFRRKEENKFELRPQYRANLHRKLHNLLAGENYYSECNTVPLLFLSPCSEAMSRQELEKNFGCIKSIEPAAIFDFDPMAHSSKKLYSVMESHFQQVYKVLTTDNFDINCPENKSSNGDSVARLFEDVKESSLPTWIFCNGYEPMDKRELQTVAWRNTRGQGFKEAVRFYEKEIPRQDARIIVLILSKAYDVLLGALEEVFTKFPDQWVIVAESKSVAEKLMDEIVRREYVERQTLEERCIIGMPWTHFNRSILKIFGHSPVSECTLHTSCGSPATLKERKRNEWSDLDILSMTQCEEEKLEGDEKDIKSRRTEEAFYRGEEVTWWNYYFKDHVLERDQTKDLRFKLHALINGKIDEDERIGVVNVDHQPGSGATTIVKHVLWDLKENTRCCIVKKITEKTSDQIAYFRSFEETDFDVPPVVLIDNDVDFEKVCYLRSQLNEKARREARLGRLGTHKIYCILIICRRLCSSLKKMGRYNDRLKVLVDHELQEHELLWFKKKAKEIDEKYKESHGSHPALLLSFNLMKENFSRKYIQSTVDYFINELHSFKERRLLKYIALINTYDPAFQSIPFGCFNPIMRIGNNKDPLPMLGKKVTVRGDTYWTANLSSNLNVLINRTTRRFLGKGVDAVRIINGNFSQEILENLFKRERNSLSYVLIEFLQSEIFSKANKSDAQDQLARIVKSMLKTRLSTEKARDDFSPIILAVAKKEDYEKAATVLKSGFDAFEDPMIAQQAARVYLRLEEWDQAEQCAEEALDMDQGNSFLCDTYGQVFRWKLDAMWRSCFENLYNLDNEVVREMMEIGFRAIELFQEEQRLTDSDQNSDYNSYGFTSELRVISTLLDICSFLKPFACNLALIRQFLLSSDYVPAGLLDILDKETIEKLKQLRHLYERPLRRLEEEGIQLKDDPSYQGSTSYNSYRDSFQIAARIKARLLSFFGEDSDKVPLNMSPQEACEFRRRRVKVMGGLSLYSTHGMREVEGSAKKCEKMYDMIMQNVASKHCNSDDLRTVLDLTVVRLSINKGCSKSFSISKILGWSLQLYKMSSLSPRIYLESFLYLVVFHWPTQWRTEQKLPLCSCHDLKDAVVKWKQTFYENHPAQTKERKRPDRRKATTLFFLGEGTGFDEIAFYSEIRHLESSGEGIWDHPDVHRRLKLLTGTLRYEGKRVSLTINSPSGGSEQLELPTSIPIEDDFMWQRPVYFFLGFSWSGPKAFGVRMEPPKYEADGTQNIMPKLSTGVPRMASGSRQTLSSSEEAQFWREFSESQKKLEELERKARVCPQKDAQESLQEEQKKVKKAIQVLMQKRQSAIGGSD